VHKRCDDPDRPSSTRVAPNDLHTLQASILASVMKQSLLLGARPEPLLDACLSGSMSGEAAWNARDPTQVEATLDASTRFSSRMTVRCVQNAGGQE
jgi:hypothetical protein